MELVIESFYSSKLKKKHGRSKGRKDRVGDPLLPSGSVHYSPGVGLYELECDLRNFADETEGNQEGYEALLSPTVASDQTPTDAISSGRRTQETRLPLRSRTNDPPSISQHQNIQQENRGVCESIQILSGIGNTPTGTGQVLQSRQDRRIPFRHQANDITLHSLIQEQQATLQALLEVQQAIQEKQLALEQKVCDLEKTQASAVSQSTTTTLKRKKLVPSHLSVSQCSFTL